MTKAEATAETAATPGRSWVVGAVVLALFAAVAVSVRSVLSPFVLYLLFLYVTWPWIQNPLYARLAVAASGVMAIWILHVTGLLLVPFILAGILAYAVDPLVDLLEEHMPRPLAVGTLAVPLLAVLVVGGFLLVPLIGGQVGELLASVPSYLNEVEAWLTEVRAWLIGLNLPGVTDATLPELRNIDSRAVAQYIGERQAEIAKRGLDAVLGIGRGIGTVLTLAGYLVLLPVLTYYVLRDWDRIREQVTSLVPKDHREDVVRFAGRYDELLSRYLRGQLLLGLIVGVLVAAGFWIVGFPYALLLGLVAGVLNIVPYLGIVVTVGVAVLIALFTGPLPAALLKVAAVFGVEQVIEQAVGPKIVGEAVGLHPVWVLLALALFSFFFGLVGLLIAVPAAVFLKLVITAGVERYRQSHWFRKGALP